MPAINGLLPVVSSQPLKKEAEQGRANEPKSAPVKEAVQRENKGPLKEEQIAERGEKKRFNEMLQEKKSERESNAAQEAEERAEQVTRATEALDELAESGNVLPSKGEGLPAITAEEAANNARFAGVEPELAEAKRETEPTQAPVTMSPALAKESILPETQVSGQPIQTATATATSASLSDALDTPPTLRSDTVVTTTAPKPELVTQQEPAVSPVQTTADEPNTSVVNATVLGQAHAAPALQTADALAVSAMPGSDVDSGLAEQGQRTPLNGAPANDTRPSSDQAERVRAWRGLNTQELQTNNVQVARAEPALNSGALEQSGQFQQFAQSLRLAVKQNDSATVATGGDRSVASASASSASSGSESVTSWRTETTQAQLPSAAARQGGNATNFAQTMQASNFGQTLGEKVGQNAWGESIAQRVTLMAGQKMSSAQIQLDPPELGAMTVKVTVNGDQASVSFHSAHAVVRDALEASFPRLQEMLSQQGIELADAQVSDQSSAQQDSRSGANAVARKDGVGSDDEAVIHSAQTVRSATGLIDYYA